MRLGILRATDCHSSKERSFLTRLSLVIPFPELPHLRQWTKVTLTVRTRRQIRSVLQSFRWRFVVLGFSRTLVQSPRHGIEFNL
jgi:hypothetical protein